MLISGLKLGTLIKEKDGVTQETVAEALGKTRPTINQWTKKAEVEVTLTEAEKIAKLLKVSLQDLTVQSSTSVRMIDEDAWSELKRSNERHDQANEFLRSEIIFLRKVIEGFQATPVNPHKA